MPAFAPNPSIWPSTWGVAFRFALRELRGGLRGFYIFIACIALGVAAIAGVGSASRSMTGSIATQGQSILGGDLSFSLILREAEPEERAYLESQGAVSRIATLRAMARLPERNEQTLVEVKAVDGAYPLYGTMELAGGGGLASALEKRGEAWGAVADEELLARLGIKAGEVISLGKIRVAIADTIKSEPDKLSGGLGFGPRLMLADAALRASGLVQPGSLVRWHYRLKLANAKPDETGEVRAVAERVKKAHPKAGWRIRSRDNASPGLSRNIRRFAQFLTLVGLTALMVGGVGVANAVRSFLESKRDVIATFKCLGASGSLVFRIYLIQIAILSGIGIVIGLALGALMPLAVDSVLAGFLPIKTRAGLYPFELLTGLAYGLLTALAFAMWPLGRAHDVPPTALFRDVSSSARAWPRPVYVAIAGAIVLVLAGMAIGFAFDRFIASIFVAAAAASFVLLRLVAGAIQWLAKRAPQVSSTELRLALGNIHRPGALTGSVVLSLGLGITLLVTITLIDGNLRRQLTSTMPAEAPSFFFLDIQNYEVNDFEALLRKEAPKAEISRVPMLRGRMVTLDGVPAEKISAPPNVQWALRGDRGITYSAEKPKNAILTEGKWWPKDYSGPPLVSYEADLGQAFGLKIGDPIVVNVLGREIEARIANFRSVEWQSLAINFVMVFSPDAFAGAPHTHLATITWLDGADAKTELALLKKVTAAFPAVTSVRVKDALTEINALVAQLAWAIRAASSITLIASILVLGGALAASHRNRIHDAVVLKMLGATRRRLVAAFSIEYALLGLATAVFGLFAGSVAAWFVIEKMMGGTFVLLPFVAIGATAAALLLTVGFGLVGTWKVLGDKPAPVLRNL